MNQKFFFHLELSKKCALKCPRCPRTENPEMFEPTELNLEFIQRHFTKSLLGETERVLICGGEGDPIYCRDFLGIVRYFKTIKPHLAVDIVSNGSYRSDQWWTNLAGLLNEYDKFVFSLDGWDQTSNEKYRVNCDWDSIMTGIKALRQSPVQMIWSAIEFRFNENHMPRMEKLAAELEFDWFCRVESSLVGSRNARYIDQELGCDPLEPVNKKIDSQVHSREPKKLTSRNSPLSNYKSRYSQTLSEVIDKWKNSEIIPMCQAGERGLYISADGLLHPCSWVSHPFKDKLDSQMNPGVCETWSDSYFVQSREKWNLHTKSLDEIMSSKSWKRMEELWQNRRDTPVICEIKCHKSVFEKKNHYYLKD